MKHIRETPWDRRNFHINTFEVMTYTEEALKETDEYRGHYTVKVDPMENPKNLLKYNFYYMDTLLEPICTKEKLHVFDNTDTTISKEYVAEDVTAIAEEAFMHGRFHRDFNIPSALANLRYRNWVKDLQEKDLIFALYYRDKLAGFYGYEGDKVLLLGMKKAFQNKGLAKAFTSSGCKEQFNLGHHQLRTSISATNVSSLNLFYSLGFKLAGSVDVYHKLNGSAPVVVS